MRAPTVDDVERQYKPCAPGGLKNVVAKPGLA
jgi:hypothetical protein